MGTGNAMDWTAEADRKLLLAIISLSNVSIDHNQMAAHMGCTPSAIKNRMFKLRSLAKEEQGKLGIAGASSTSPAAPSKGKKRMVGGTNTDGGEDHEANTPVKKPRGRAKTAKKEAEAEETIKEEQIGVEDNEDEDDIMWPM